MADYGVQIIRSDPTIHFTTAIAKQTYEPASLSMTTKDSSDGEIIGVSVSSTDNLQWVVWFFTKGTSGTVWHPYTLADTRTDADIHTFTQIGDTGWVVADYQYDRDYVTTTGGTGSGQTRRISLTEANSGNGRLTVEPAFTTEPDATTDFRVDPDGRIAGHVTCTAMNPATFGGSDTLYRWSDTNLRIPYKDDTGLYEIHVGLFNDDGSNAKTNYAGGGRVQVEIAFRPTR